MSEQSAGISNTLGIFAGRRIQQNARGLKRLRGQNHCLSPNLLRLLRRAMYKRDAARFVRACVHIHMAHYGVSEKRAVPRLECILHGGERTAEIGVSKTTALARSAIMARRPAIVWRSKNGDASHGES